MNKDYPSGWANLHGVSRVRAILVVLGLSLFVVKSAAAAGADRERSEDSDYTYRVELKGTEGAAFKGYYLTDKGRTSIRGKLPWSATLTNVTRVQVGMEDPSESIEAEADGGGSGGFVYTYVGSGRQRIRLNLSPGGVSSELVMHDWTVELGDVRLGLLSRSGRSTLICAGFDEWHLRARPGMVLLTGSVLVLSVIGGAWFLRARAGRGEEKGSG